jgi:hypothetical protein
VTGLAVGRLYNPRVREWPERPHLRLAPRFCELALFYPGLGAGEIAQVRYGEAVFAWVDGGPASVLCFKFGDLDWADCTYEPHLAPASERGAPRLTEDGHLVVGIVLVEATTGVVAALRAVGWPPGFSAAVTGTVTRQLAARRDDDAAAAVLGRLYRHRTEVLAGQATARCRIPGRPS